MKKLLFVVGMILVISSLAHAQSHVDSLIIQGKEQIQSAVDGWDLQKMIAARGFFERLLNDPTYLWLAHYYIGYADMRIVTYYFSKEDKDRALEWVNDGIKHLKKSIELKGDFAEPYSLLSSLYGNKIGIKPLLGMILGPKSGGAQKKAFELAPQNPRSHLIAGESAYYTPKLFGGGKEKALKYLHQAAEYFITYQPKGEIYPSWGYEETYAYLGLIQMDKGNFDLARENFQKALQINLHYGWVKFYLMKELEKKASKEKK